MDRYSHLMCHFVCAPAYLIFKLPTVYQYIILLPVIITNTELHSHFVVAVNKQIQEIMNDWRGVQ